MKKMTNIIFTKKRSAKEAPKATEVKKFLKPRMNTFKNFR